MGFIDSLRLPEAQDIDNLDAPSTTILHQKIINKKPFLKRLYVEFYQRIIDQLEGLSPTDSCIVELGSGGGFFKDSLPHVITSEVMDLPDVDLHFSATEMPFQNESLDAIVMVDVLHHVPDSRAFLSEAMRCLKPGGRVVMVEPANTSFSRFIYQNFHHEPFDPKGDWGFKAEGPLSSANGAIPWILFFRDRVLFEKEYPQFRIQTRKNHTPFRYLLSGGLSFKQLVPTWSFGLLKAFEFILTPLHSLFGMFLTVTLVKQVR